MAIILHESRNGLLENSITINISENNEGDPSILSDEGNNCDIEYITFADGDDTVVEEDDNHNFFGDDLEWDQWYPIGNDDDVPRPPMNDFYN